MTENTTISLEDHDRLIMECKQLTMDKLIKMSGLKDDNDIEELNYLTQELEKRDKKICWAIDRINILESEKTDLSKDRREEIRNEIYLDLVAEQDKQSDSYFRVYGKAISKLEIMKVFHCLYTGKNPMLISELFNTVKEVMGGNKDFTHYENAECWQEHTRMVYKPHLIKRIANWLTGRTYG